MPQTSYSRHLPTSTLYARSTTVGYRGVFILEIDLPELPGGSSNLVRFNGSRKAELPEYYRKARLAGLIVSNILAGWKGSGLWPLSLTKPLMSPLLVGYPKEEC